MNLKNKKIGIWGFGIVGASVFNYVKKLTNYVQILDKKPHPTIVVILQTPETIQKFLDENDYIIASPGIPLHDYESYRQKFICELDIFASEYHGSIIAITGTAGKTTVTDFIAQSIPNAIAAGNIGFAMLDVLSLNPQPKTVALELSSYQLQYAHDFAPDIAIWTNFFPNHLDHHKNIDEYFQSKCNILKFQKSDQKAIIAHELVDEILNTVDYQGQLFTYSTDGAKFDNDKENKLQTSPGVLLELDSRIHSYQKYSNFSILGTFYIEDNNLVLCKNNQTTIIFENINALPQTTFLTNWIVILATLYLKKQNLSELNFAKLITQPHRVEFVETYNNVKIYNDSKSTIWESTKQALTLFPHKKIALIIGGMSKGADRSPLFKYIAQQKNITSFIFGKEKEMLTAFCNKHHMPYFSSETLEELLEIFKTHHQDFDILLFSPAGSSFDQFKNYQDRGNIFKILVQELL